MPAKEQKVLFRQALEVHQQASDESSLRTALSLYDEAAAAASLTFPIAFNSAAVCLAVSQVVVSKPEAHGFREDAARRLDEALTLLPRNLEALVARAAVEDAFARESSDVVSTLSHRTAASKFLEQGAVAEPSDEGVRLLLVEALIQVAEAAAEASDPSLPPQDLLGRGESMLNEAIWLIEVKIRDLTRMRTDPNGLQKLEAKRTLALVVRAKLMLAMSRLGGRVHAQWAQELRQAEADIRSDGASANDPEALLARAELLEAASERESGNGVMLLNDALDLCRASIRAFERDSSSETDERQFEARALLGDLCLARIRSEKDTNAFAQLLAEGAGSYEAVVRAGESGRIRSAENETPYNMACLLVLGKAAGCDMSYSERQIAELLKKSVDSHTVGSTDLAEDPDLDGVKRQAWFARLLKYAERQRS